MKAHAGLAGLKHFRAGRALESIRLDTLKSGTCLLLKQWISLASEESGALALLQVGTHSAETPPLHGNGAGPVRTCCVPAQVLASLPASLTWKASAPSTWRWSQPSPVGSSGATSRQKSSRVPPGGANCSASGVPQQAPSSLRALAGHPPDIQMPDPPHSSQRPPSQKDPPCPAA